MEAVVLKHVSKSYLLGAVPVPAVQHVDLTIAAGRFAVISGASGSGKTTLLNLIGCIDRPDSGAVLVDGCAIGALKDDALTDFRARHIGFIFQNFNLLPVLDVYENVEYPLLLTRTAPARRRARVRSLLEAVGLQDREKHRPNQLSGGQRQRVAIARALAAGPRLVLADEPTANLDSHTGAAIIALMRRMQQEEGVSFVISTHDPALMLAADEAIVILDGRIQA